MQSCWGWFAELLATRERTGVFRPKDVFEQEQAELVVSGKKPGSQALVLQQEP